MIVALSVMVSISCHFCDTMFQNSSIFARTPFGRTDTVLFLCFFLYFLTILSFFLLNSLCFHFLNLTDRKLEEFFLKVLI